MRKSYDYVQVLLKNSAAVFLLLLLFFNCIKTPNFLTANTFWNLVIHATPVILVSLAMTFVISSGGINISVGSVMAISGMLLVRLLPQLGLGTALFLAVSAGIVMGVLTGIIITVFNIQPIIVSLGMMIAGRGAAQMISNGYILRFDSPRLMSLALSRFNTVPVQVFYVLISVLIYLFIAKKTTFARYVESLGDNYKASYLSGVQVTAILTAVYALSGLMSAFAGIITVARAGAADPDTIGRSLEMTAIAAVAIGDTKMTGGKARIIGTLLGAFIMQLITTTINMNNIPYEWSLVISTGVILLAVFLQNIREE
ncbi:MAG: ABC transporter permease [Treponema sp.]|jgi:ribose/xylose/arabinose/galactoside ABC-type transport system permease subunit|nr:ABC transporter permease [Treponema sp.]